MFVYLFGFVLHKIMKMQKPVNYPVRIVVLALVVGMEHLVLDSGIRSSYRTNAIRLHLQQQAQRGTLQWFSVRKKIFKK